jgi:hypothetical protein
MDQALQQDILTWATVAVAAVGVLTLLVLICYTIDTQRLRKAAERQNQISVMPIVVLRLSSGERRLGEPLSLSLQSLRNVGNGPAFNISITTIKNSPFEVRFNPVPILEARDTQALDYTIWQDAATTGFSKMTVWLESVIEAGQLGSEMVVSVSYSDASGKQYFSNHVIQFDAAAKTVTTMFQDHREL